MRKERLLDTKPEIVPNELLKGSAAALILAVCYEHKLTRGGKAVLS